MMSGSIAGRDRVYTVAVCALAAALTMLAFRQFRDIEWPEAGFVIAITSVAVAVAVAFGERRGLRALWALLGVLWAVYLVILGGRVKWHVAAVMVDLPEMSTAWSYLTLPIACATTWVLRGDARRGGRIALVGALAVLLAWALASEAMAGYAPDVWGSPRTNAWLIFPLGILSVPLPFAYAWWFRWRLREIGG